MTQVIHAVRLTQMVDGGYRLYGYSLCGEPPVIGHISADPQEVTCKRCLGSRGWAYFCGEAREHRKYGRLATPLNDGEGLS